MINSIFHNLKILDKVLKSVFNINFKVQDIRDNFVEVLLMIDQYLLDGIPVFDDVNILSSLICPYGVTDKFTEKFIGKAKEYDTKTLTNYLNELNLNNDSVFKYKNEITNLSNQILFHFIDYLEISLDKDFNNILNKNCFSELEVISSVSTNVKLNLLLNIPFNVIEMSLDDSVTTK